MMPPIPNSEVLVCEWPRPELVDKNRKAVYTRRAIWATDADTPPTWHQCWKDHRQFVIWDGVEWSCIQHSRVLSDLRAVRDKGPAAVATVSLRPDPFYADAVRLYASRAAAPRWRTGKNEGKPRRWPAGPA